MKSCRDRDEGRTTPRTPRRAAGRAAHRSTGLLALSVLTLALPLVSPAAAATPTAATPTAAVRAAPAGAGVVGPTSLGPCVGITVTAQDVQDPAALRRFQSTVDQPGNVGATFCLKAGVYREWTLTPRRSQKFIGEPGVVLTGARLLTGFTADPASRSWKIGGQAQKPGQAWNGGCLPGRPACHLPEELFIDDVRQTRVLTLAEVGRDTWFFNYDTDTIYVGNDPTGPNTRVETSVVPYAFMSVKDKWEPNVTVANLVVEKYASPGHMSTIGQQHLSPGWSVEHTEVRLNHGGGIAVNGGRAVQNRVHHNGHQGISGTGADTLVEGNEIAYNNAAGYDYGNEGGAGKFSSTTDLVYRHNHVHHNFGTGAWTDIDNLRTVYENNVIEYNHGPGIMHEISHAATISNNILRENDEFNIRPDNGNIVISSSRDVKVTGNTIVVGKQSGTPGVAPESRLGIYILQAHRNESFCGGICRSDNITVENNTIRYLDRLRYLGSGAGYSHTGVMMTENAVVIPAGVVFRNNAYTMPDCAENRWSWVLPKPGGGWTGPRGPFTAWQRAGYDTTGSCRSEG